MDLARAGELFQEFAAVIKRLRTPGTGCPWDLEQDHQSLKPFVIEEAYEVLDAIDRGDDLALREELGDLLLQVVLHAQVAEDRDAFSLIEVVSGIERKMVRRHPHVFGDGEAADSAQVVRNWDEIKAAEAREKGHDASLPARLARLPESLPALQRAQRLGEKAAKAGHKETVADLLASARSLLDALERQALSLPDPAPAKLPDAQRRLLEREMGELFFALAQLARCLGLHAEESLRAANRRFIEGF
jgi:MazG family protein